MGMNIDMNMEMAMEVEPEVHQIDLGYDSYGNHGNYGNNNTNAINYPNRHNNNDCEINNICNRMNNLNMLVKPCGYCKECEGEIQVLYLMSDTEDCYTCIATGNVCEDCWMDHGDRNIGIMTVRNNEGVFVQGNPIFLD